jgi:hypothetical protein
VFISLHHSLIEFVKFAAVAVAEAAVRPSAWAVVVAVAAAAVASSPD